MLLAIGSTFSCSQAQRDKTVSGMAVSPGFQSLVAAGIYPPPPVCLAICGFNSVCRSSNRQLLCSIKGSRV
jgi:hypothetical protein